MSRRVPPGRAGILRAVPGVPRGASGCRNAVRETQTAARGTPALPRAIALLVGVLWFASCRVPSVKTEPPGVTRREVMAIAQTYLSHPWTAAPANVFHGLDADAIRVDTPDIGQQPGGWWKTGAVNTGLPYCWGGFETPESFDAKLRQGKYAGDIYTLQKRKLLDDAVSRHTAGIDCSGLISRCWKLPRSYSTRELAALCVPLASYGQLLPGDVLNLHNAHALLFDGYTDATLMRMIIIEVGSDPQWKVQRHSIAVSKLQREGYRPLRYRGIRGQVKE